MKSEKIEALSDSDSTVSRLGHLETELAELSVNVSADLGHVECGLLTAQKDLELLRSFVADQLQTVDRRLERGDGSGELLEKISAVEVDLNEHTILTSAMNGHLEGAVATAKQVRGQKRHKHVMRIGNKTCAELAVLLKHLMCIAVPVRNVRDTAYTVPDVATF